MPTTPGTVAATVQVRLRGELSVRLGPVVLGPRQLGGVKPRRLLLALLLARGAPVSKDRLGELLWDGPRPVTAAATIEAYVCVLRKRLDPQSGPRASLIETRAGGYRIERSRLDLDVDRSERLASRALHPATAPADAVALLREALAEATAPLVPDEGSADWIAAARAAHEVRTRELLVAAAEKVALVAPDDATRWAQLALDSDPLDESAWYALLHTKERSGDHADGLRAYGRCRTLFADELGCAPGPRLQELYGRLLGGGGHPTAGRPHGGAGELEQLIEAVVRLHHDLSAGPSPTADEPGRGVARGISSDHARRALTALVQRSARSRPRLVRTESA